MNIAVQNKASLKKLLRPILALGLVASLLFVGSALLVHFVIVNQANERQLILMSSQKVDDYSRAVAGYLSSQQEDLARLANYDLVRHAVTTALDDERELIAEEFQEAYADAVKLTLLPLSPLGIAASSFPAEQFNPIEIDMIRAASYDEPAYPEASTNGKNFKLVLAQPIKDTKGTIVGVALLNIRINALTKQLAKLAVNQGELILEQGHHAQNPISLARIGVGSDSAPAVMATVENSNNWRLTFIPSKALQAIASMDTTIIWLSYAGAVVVVFLLCGLIYRSTVGILTREAAALDQYLAMLGQSPAEPADPALTLAPLAEIAERARRLRAEKITARQQRATEQTKKQAKPAQKKAEKKRSAIVKETIEPAAVLTPELNLFEGGHEPEYVSMPAHIFRAYDIRGLAGTELSDSAAYQIGRGFGSNLDEQSKSVIVARDGRLSSPEITDHLVQGLLDSGANVTNIGAVPTPLMNFATHTLGISNGLMVTGSHNPKEYNGIKIVQNQASLTAEEIQQLYQRIAEKQFTNGHGEYCEQSIEERYVDYIAKEIGPLEPMRVVIDAGNGIAGNIATLVFSALNCEVIPLYCDVDGNFPNHHPDPTVAENLSDLITMVNTCEAHIGLAFDGDGDRLGVVTGTGQVVVADTLLAIFARDVLSKEPGSTIVYDVKCSRVLDQTIVQHGGKPLMWKSGHSMIRAKVNETNAALGGEYSAHFFFNDSWFGFDDGIYAGARLLEIINRYQEPLDKIAGDFPMPPSTPEIAIAIDEQDKFAIVEAISQNAAFGDAQLTKIDGLRVDYPEGWGLLRASNTTSNLILRFEADNIMALKEIKQRFKYALLAEQPSLSVKL
ncbi:MAG: phosphomannomutase/phosphoglucomutase [Pseudomonadales bacterium]